MAYAIQGKIRMPQASPPQEIVPFTFYNEESNLLKFDQSTMAVIRHLNSITVEIRNGASNLTTMPYRL